MAAVKDELGEQCPYKGDLYEITGMGIYGPEFARWH